MLWAMRDLEVIASKLRLIASIRRTAAEVGAPAPSIGLADELLDVWSDEILHEIPALWK